MDIKTELECFALEQNIVDPIIEYLDTYKNDGYLSNLKFATITGKDDSGKEISLSIVIKNASLNPKVREKFIIPTTVACEIFAYKYVFPTLRNCEIKYTNNFQEFAPKCYTLYENKETIIMENLQNIGYDTFDHKQEMDGGHVRKILDHYAEFHSTSYALRILEPEKFKNLLPALKPTLLAFFKQTNFYEILVKMVRKAKLSLDPVIDADIIKKYIAFVSNLDETIEQLLIKDNTPLVILHGDAWFNNILIKYGDRSSKHPSSVRLIDFQFTYAGTSPTIDLTQFIYTCASNDVIENLEIYQKHYYTAFAKKLKAYGLNSETTYTFSKFKREWKNYARFGFIVACLFRYVVLADQNDVPDFNKACELEINLLDLPFYETMKNIDEYHKRIRNVIIHLAKNDFL